MKSGPKIKSLVERFWSHVQITSACWFWTGSIDSKTGYGHFAVIPRNRGSQLALSHRVSYELHVGPIPAELEIDHLCHLADKSCLGGITCLHRRCVNPAHLEAVTPHINTLSSRMSTKTICIRGHDLTNPANVYVRGHGNGRRQCRACHALEMRERKRKNKQGGNTSAPTQQMG